MAAAEAMRRAHSRKRASSFLGWKRFLNPKPGRSLRSEETCSTETRLSRLNLNLSRIRLPRPNRPKAASAIITSAALVTAMLAGRNRSD
jgi:hypothetical protein